MGSKDGELDIREAGGASDASQEGTDEERVDGEVEETAKHCLPTI